MKDLLNVVRHLRMIKDKPLKKDVSFCAVVMMMCQATS